MNRNVRQVVCLFLMCMFVSSPTLWARASDVEIDGLVIDQSRSKAGHDFANNFSLLWETTAVGYNIVINEQADGRNGTWISIEIHGELVFKALMKPNANEIEALAQEAVADCNEFLAQRQEANANLDEEKDLKGDGI